MCSVIISTGILQIYDEGSPNKYFRLVHHLPDSSRINIYLRPKNQDNILALYLATYLHKQMLEQHT